MHDLIACFLGVIALVIILLFVGLAALQVLIVTPRKIVALILSMTIVRSAIVAIALVALMIVSILVAMMLLVALFTAMRGRKMSRFLVFLAAFNPLQSSCECQPLCGLLGTARRK